MSQLYPASAPKDTTFLDDVCNDNYILVVGSEVILRKDGDFEPYHGDSNEYILHLLKEKDEDLSEKKKAKIKTINDFMGTLVNGENAIRDLFSEDNREIEDMAPELVSLLKTKVFKFVMTTTIDDYVEKLMKQIYGDDLNVVCFDTESWSALKNSMDPSAEGEPYDKPTLVYVFGKISNNNKVSFVRNDNDAIRFIQDWLKESGSVIDYITSRRILALGCKFENWYFRFLWYILKRKFVTSQDRDGGGEVAISFNEEDFSDLRLKAYLEQNKISLLSDARQFMREVCEDFDLKLLTPEKKQALRSKMATGGIFISYKSENFAFAHKLFVQLKSLGYKVWFDCDKLHGGDFKKIIIDAIHKAKAVVTILSLEVAKDLEEGRTQEFYNDEWRWATQLDSDKEKVIPLAIDGYDLRSSYHKVFNKIISSASEKKVDGFDLMKAGKYTDFLNRIDELLKIK